MSRSPRDQIRIGDRLPELDESYDIDGVGQDDGTDPDPERSFRLLFQLGRGFMIHLYVVGMARPGDPRSFHTFWTRDCAVSHVDVEDHGPPLRVSCEELELPSVYERAHLTSADATASFDVERRARRAREQICGDHPTAR